MTICEERLSELFAKQLKESMQKNAKLSSENYELRVFMKKLIAQRRLMGKEVLPTLANEAESLLSRLGR